jgi:hypothetical protein
LDGIYLRVDNVEVALSGPVKVENGQINAVAPLIAAELGHELTGQAALHSAPPSLWFSQNRPDNLGKTICRPLMGQT